MRVIFLEDGPQVNEYTARFRAATRKELVDACNREVGNPGWVSRRGRYLTAMYQEFRRRDIDISVIDTGNGMSLDRHVALDGSGRRLIIV